MEERLKRMGAKVDGPNTKQAVQGLIEGGMRGSRSAAGGAPRTQSAIDSERLYAKSQSKGTTAGRKPCTVCKKRPADMVAHFRENADSHGPLASSNEHAMNNLPGLRTISEGLGRSLLGGFNDRRK